MISRSEFVTECLSRGDVRGAIEHVLHRARTWGDIPDKSVDPWRDYKLVLNRMIDELCEARNE